MATAPVSAPNKVGVTATTPIDQLPLYLSVTEVAAFLRISRWTLYPLVRAGKLPSKRFGNKIRIPRNALVCP